MTAKPATFARAVTLKGDDWAMRAPGVGWEHVRASTRDATIMRALCRIGRDDIFRKHVYELIGG